MLADWIRKKVPAEFDSSLIDLDTIALFTVLGAILE